MTLTAILASPVHARSAPPPPLAAYLRDALEVTRYRWAAADFGGDGGPEFVVYDRDPGSCGTGGCTLWVVSCEGTGPCRTILQAPLVRLPVRVLTTRTNGWLDLAVTHAGGGMPTSVVRLRFNPAGREDEVPETSDLSSDEPQGRILIP